MEDNHGRVDTGKSKEADMTYGVMRTTLDVLGATVIPHESPDGVRGAMVLFSDGTREHIKGEWPWRIAIQRQALEETVVAATPGFELLRFQFLFFDAEPNVAAVLDPHNRGPIIAWRTFALDEPEPIGVNLNAPETGSGREAIRRPDGVVINYDHSQSWRDINAWAEDVVVEWRQWREEIKTDPEALKDRRLLEEKKALEHMRSEQ
jgi:hypothetical protein